MKTLKNARLPFLGSRMPLPCVSPLSIGNHKRTDFEGAYSGDLKGSISTTLPNLDSRGGRLYPAFTSFNRYHLFLEQAPCIIAHTASLCRAFFLPSVLVISSLDSGTVDGNYSVGCLLLRNANRLSQAIVF